MGEFTLVSAWTAARKRLGAIVGVDEPTFEARLFVEAATGATRLDILTDPHRPISPEAGEALEAMLTRREAREPAAHILGYKDFWTFRLAVSSDVLTPRPETELLVKTALELMPADANALDLGAGSGAVLLALLSERPGARGLGLDMSAEALVLARANSAALGLAERAAWRWGDWSRADATADLEGAFDVVVANPPYVRSGAISLLEPEVARYEPHLALDGGPDGLDAYRSIFPLIRRLLRQRVSPDPGADAGEDAHAAGEGAATAAWAVEIGQGQAEAVWALADEAGLAPEGVRDDLAGIARVVFGRAAPQNGR
jgi:release factor glutamine methyltransferase